MQPIECTRCNHEFEHELWESGECPKCKNGFWWDELCDEDYSDCSPYIIWDSYDKIPEGVYCYDKNGLCPYWSKREDKPAQENGYCSLIQKGDWEAEHLSLLWDQVKECSLNDKIDWENYV